MNWNEDKDILLLKEMGRQGIFHYKARSGEPLGKWLLVTLTATQICLK